MSAANYIGYFAYMIETGKMTKEEANKRLEEMFEADRRQDEFDRKMIEHFRRNRAKYFAYRYWDKTEFGRRMVESNDISDSDLLFLIPNNVKKMNGIPLTRTSGKKKRKQKVRRAKNIMHNKCAGIIEETANDAMMRRLADTSFFDSLVNIKDVSLGDKYA